NVRIATVTTAFMSYIYGIKHGSFIRFRDLDLTGVRKIGFRIQQNGAGGTAEVRQGSKDGTIVARLAIPAGKSTSRVDGWRELTAVVTGTTGVSDLYIVFVNDQAADQNLFHIDWLKFYNK